VLIANSWWNKNTVTLETVFAIIQTTIQFSVLCHWACTKISVYPQWFWVYSLAGSMAVSICMVFLTLCGFSIITLYSLKVEEAAGVGW